MRLIRIGALFLSLILITATVASAVLRRASTARELDDRAAAAAEVGAAAVDSEIRRALSIVTLAAAARAPSDDGSSDAVDAASLVGSFSEASACWTAAASNCTGPDLGALRVVGEALRRLGDGGSTTVALVDTSSSSVVVVGVDSTTAIVQLPLTTLAAAATAAVDAVSADPGAADGNGADGAVDDAEPDVPAVDALAAGTTSVDVELYGGAGEVRDRARNDSDGRRAQRVVTGSLDEGAVSVLATAPGDIGMTGGGGAAFAGLLGLGVVLLGLAAWASRVERRKLERRATTDDLTGLVNRREFERLGSEALIHGERFGTGVCLMLMDLNGFKQINDTLGHQVGDVVLQEAAARLVMAVRDTDVVGRWGGDEFVVLLPGLEDGTTVRVIAERIGSALADAPIDADSDALHVSGSLGAAIYPRHGSTFQQMLHAADGAMYGAKATGVTYRLADVISAEADVLSPDYIGPDRRRTPTEV